MMCSLAWEIVVERPLNEIASAPPDVARDDSALGPAPANCRHAPAGRDEAAQQEKRHAAQAHTRAVRRVSHGPASFLAMRKG